MFSSTVIQFVFLILIYVSLGETSDQNTSGGDMPLESPRRTNNAVDVLVESEVLGPIELKMPYAYENQKPLDEHQRKMASISVPSLFKLS